MQNRQETKKFTKRENGTLRVQTVNSKPTRTQQQHKDECDVNLIIAKYKKTGLITHLNKNPGAYSDLTEIPSYTEALQTIITASDAFNALPSDFRYELHNDPQELINFLKNPANDERAIKLGLKVKPPKPDTTQQEILQTLKETQTLTKQTTKKHIPRDHTEE